MYRYGNLRCRMKIHLFYRDTLQNTATVLTGLGPPIFQKLRRRTTKRQSCDSRLLRLGPEFYRPLGLFSHLCLNGGNESGGGWVPTPAEGRRMQT